MPTNIPLQCRLIERKYLTTTPAEKLKAFEEYYAAIPKHKGTERLRTQIKTRYRSSK